MGDKSILIVHHALPVKYSSDCLWPAPNAGRYARYVLSRSILSIASTFSPERGKIEIDPDAFPGGRQWYVKNIAYDAAWRIARAASLGLQEKHLSPAIVGIKSFTPGWLPLPFFCLQYALQWDRISKRKRCFALFR